MSDELAITDNMRMEIARAFRGPLVQIDELADINARMVFDYESPVGNKMARSHVYKIRGIKGEIERQRVATKAVALEFGRAVDKRAKDLVAEVDEMIAIHQKPLDEIEQREKDRQAKIQAVIDSLFRPMGTGGIADTAAAYLAEAARVDSIDVSAPICMERAEEAATKKAGRVADLRATATQIAQEEAARAEADRIRKEEAERLRAEEVRRIEAAAVERERLAAERRAAEEAARVERERKAAEERQRAEIERVKAETEAATRKAVAEEAERTKRTEEAKEAKADRVNTRVTARAMAATMGLPGKEIKTGNGSAVVLEDATIVAPTVAEAIGLRFVAITFSAKEWALIADCLTVFSKSNQSIPVAERETLLALANDIDQEIGR